MNTRFFPGAWYGDALPTGSYVVQVPGRALETQRGPVALPAGEGWGLSFLAIAPDGVRFVGLAHDLGRTYEWTGSAWREYGYISGRAIYGADGALIDTLPAGYAFVGDDGLPVSRIANYGERNGLNQWIETSGLLIGQGHEAGGVLVLDGRDLRVLDTGACNEIRVHRDGDQVAITYRKDGAGVYVQIATLAELRALRVLTPAPKPAPVPKPEPIPEPPHMPIAPNQFALVQRVIAEHSEINRLADGPFAPNRGGITQIVAQTLGYPFGRKSKDRSSTNLGDDSLTFRLSDGRFEIYDILDGGSGAASWDYKGTFADGENGYFFSVGSAPVDEPKPAPAPNNSALFVDISPALAGILGRIGKLEDDNRALRAALEALKAAHGAEQSATALLDGAVVALRSHTEGREFLTSEPDGSVTTSAPGRPFGGYQLFTVEKQ